MTTTRYTNRHIKSVAASVLLLLALTTGYAPTYAAPNFAGVAVPPIADFPNSIASTGDSITRGFNTGTVPFTDAPANSWTTGTNATVNSHYSQILHDYVPISGHSYNDAVTGAVMAGLQGQVVNVVGQGAQYVTILLGANDACTDTEAQMTTVADYRTQFYNAMSSLTSGLPDARIFVVSVPDIYNLWAILKDNASARSTWSLLGICQSMLANPLSIDPADVKRRNRVRQRVIDYNTQLAEVCAANIHCRFDNNALFNAVFVPSDVSTRDYFHPSIAGQAKLAGVTYAATFDFRDGVPPVSTATVSKPGGGVYQVTITARDNVGVAGIEYKINNGAYNRYTGPVNLTPGSSITYRAVDVNGTTEQARVLVP